MFDLEGQIQKWRQTVAEALANKPGVIDELENHLRDDVQQLVRSDQPPGVAWEKALARLGAPGQLAAEFAKVSPAPAFWLPARIIPIAVFAVAASDGKAAHFDRIAW